MEKDLWEKRYTSQAATAQGIVLRSPVFPEKCLFGTTYCDGPRNPGWPDNIILDARARFLEQATAGGLSRKHVLEILKRKYQKLTAAADYERSVLWFDACLFDRQIRYVRNKRGGSFFNAESIRTIQPCIGKSGL